MSFFVNTMVCGFSLYQILAFFLIYSCLGWCLEVIYAAVSTGQLVNRGFLNGPVCPIYGFGMMTMKDFIKFSVLRSSIFFAGFLLLLVPYWLVMGLL